MSVKNLQKAISVFTLILLVPTGYVIGLLSNSGKVSSYQIVEKVVIPVENSFKIPHFYNVETSDNYEVNNPFEAGKVVDIDNPVIDNKLENDPRFTLVSPEDYSSKLVSNISNIVIEVPNITSDNKSNISGKKKSYEKKIDSNNEVSKVISPLPKAPIKTYLEKSPNFGFLPYQPDNFLPLYKAYGRNIDLQKDKKHLGVVVGGLGMDDNLTIKAIKNLPPDVTLGFIPYSKDLQYYIDLAREYGHETILEIPLEPIDYPRKDVGNKVLLTSHDNQEHNKNLLWHLSRAHGYSGVMNYLGGAYFKDSNSIRLFSEINNRGLYFLENPTLKTGMLIPKIYQIKSNYAASVDIINREPNRKYINSRLSIIQNILNQNRDVIITAYASDLVLEILIDALNGRLKNDIQILPISAIVG